jgi:hypothetical protein
LGVPTLSPAKMAANDKIVIGLVRVNKKVELKAVDKPPFFIAAG